KCARSSPLSLHERLSFTDPPTTELHTLSLHDALPIWPAVQPCLSPSSRHSQSALCSSIIKRNKKRPPAPRPSRILSAPNMRRHRSEEHTSELQSPDHLVCRLLLEKKK